jgi:hypothetical protein
MTLQRLAKHLYLFNLALLITHEIDSGYWHEWNLFNIPGGIDLFLILNFILVAVFLIGFAKVVEWGKYASLYSALLAFSGIFAFTIHTFFILIGHQEFNTVISLTILVLIFAVSISQIIILILINRKMATQQSTQQEA